MSQLQQSDFARNYQESTMRLQKCLDSVKKQVSVEIDPDDLTALKASNYKLCFAKKVAEGAYNVVWQSFDKYLVNNTFSWTPQYQLFGSNTFEEGVTVNVSTNLKTIGLGETATLSPAGVLQTPVSGGSSTGFTMHNEYGSIHVGVSQLCTQLDGTTISSPIYVSTAAAVKGDVVLTPVETVLVWFQQDIVTSTMLSTAQTYGQELDLTDTNSKKCLYKNQKWSIVG